MGDDDHDARTIHCSNLAQDKISEELLYELFLQAGPIERVAIPKDNGKNRMYGFVTFKYQVSVPYALSVFSGTKLFNRELRLNNRQMNRNNDNNSSSNATASAANNNRNNQNRGGGGSGQGAMEPRPILPNAPLPHQFQMQQQNPFGSSALRGLSSNATNNSMMPPPMMPRMEFPANPQLDFQTLLQLGTQMMLGTNGFDMNNMGGSADDTGRRHQSKMMHRHENRTHNQNANYARDKDRRQNDRRRDRSRSRERQNNDNNWIRNRGGGGGGGSKDNRKNDRNDRNDRRGNDKNRRR